MVFFVLPGAEFSVQAEREPRDVPASAERHPQGEDRAPGSPVSAAEAAADEGKGGCHLGDGGKAAPRETPAGQEAAQRHVLPAAAPDAGEYNADTKTY